MWLCVNTNSTRLLLLPPQHSMETAYRLQGCRRKLYHGQPQPVKLGSRTNPEAPNNDPNISRSSSKTHLWTPTFSFQWYPLALSESSRLHVTTIPFYAKPITSGSELCTSGCRNIVRFHGTVCSTDRETLTAPTDRQAASSHQRQLLFTNSFNSAVAPWSAEGKSSSIRRNHFLEHEESGFLAGPSR